MMAAHLNTCLRNVVSGLRRTRLAHLHSLISGPTRSVSYRRTLIPSSICHPVFSKRSYTTETFHEFSKQNPILLRDACQCKQCIDQSTHQRDFLFSDIPPNITVSSVEPDQETGTWRVQWNNDIAGFDNHVSVFPRSTLAQVLDGVPASLDVQRTISLWDQASFTKDGTEFDFDALLKDDDVLKSALEQIQRLGLIFVVGIPEDTEAVRKMVARLALLRNTFYGETWDVKSVPQAKNVAYTNKYLGFHMDLLYMKEPPGLQLLHCLQNSCQGGESLFADTFKAVDVLRRENPRFVDRLARSKIRYGYANDGHFYSDEKPVIKLGNTKLVPMARILNAADPEFMEGIDCVFWSPPFINSIANAAHDGDTHEFIQASKAFADILQRPEMIHETKLAAGTCTIFDNLRVVHARREFDVSGGSRWLKGIYGDRQDVLSKSLKHVWAK